jgi:hypothetical protein
MDFAPLSLSFRLRARLREKRDLQFSNHDEAKRLPYALKGGSLGSQLSSSTTLKP